MQMLLIIFYCRRATQHCVIGTTLPLGQNKEISVINMTN